MKKKLASAITAGALALSTVAVAPEASAAPALTTQHVTTLASNPNTSDSSSEAGEVIAVLVLLVAFLGIYGWFSPYNPNGAWANAAK